MPSAAFPLRSAFLAALWVLGIGNCLGEDAPTAPPNTPDPAAVAAALVSDDLAQRTQAVLDACEIHEASMTSALLRQLGRETNGGLRVQIVQALAQRRELPDRRKTSTALVGRLARLSTHVADRNELLATIFALGQLGQASAVRPLIDGISNDTDEEQVRARLAAVAVIPDVEAVDRLIQFLSKFGKGKLGHQRDAARDALLLATGQKLGNDPDSWRAWWKDARTAFDFAAVAAERAEAARAKEDKAEAREERRKKRDADDGDSQPGKP